MTTTRSVRFSQSVCTHCGRPVVGLPRESAQFGIVQAECQARHKRRLAYYNDTDPFCCGWLRNLIDAGLIAFGDVDNRSIEDVTEEDVAGYRQCHFFAGIGGWSLALRNAGWPDDRPVWTGSCPCQPFSSAGKQEATADSRHLWPELARLISECRPPVVFGEQVEGAIRHGWLDGVFGDLERSGYACGAAVLGAHSVGAPHIRQRLYWVAESSIARRTATIWRSRFNERNEPESRCCGVGDRLGDTGTSRQAKPEHEGRATEQPSGAWSHFTLVGCRDGQSRRISAQPGDEPLAYGIPVKLGQSFSGLRGVAKDARRNRVGRLRAYGNAIVPQLATEFILCFADAITSTDLQRQIADKQRKAVAR